MIVWVTYLGIGHRDEEDCLIHGNAYKVLGETEKYYIIEDMTETEVAISKYKFETCEEESKNVNQTKRN